LTTALIVELSSIVDSRPIESEEDEEEVEEGFH
jgi:hypothetical protein